MLQTTHPLPSADAGSHEYLEVDVSDAEGVREAARGTDCIVNCSVLRHHPQQSFQVNVLGAFNAISAAVAEGHSRLVHTGPIHAFRQQGSSYEFGISEEVRSGYFPSFWPGPGKDPPLGSGGVGFLRVDWAI